MATAAAATRRSRLGWEIAGGAAAAALTLPVGISLGIVTLEPLGSHFAPLGVAAGVWGLVIVSVLTVAFGTRNPVINLPRSVTAVFVAAMLLQAAGVHRTLAHAAPPPEFLYGLAFLFLAMSGAFMALIGVLRIGALVKYLPHACTAERIALQNLKNGVPANLAAVRDNPYCEWIGALVRAR